MHAIDYGLSIPIANQQLLSPNSTGHSRNGQCPYHRYHSHSCKSAPAEQHWKENSREYEDEHWLFSPVPDHPHIRLESTAAVSCSQERQVSSTYRDRPLTPLSPNPAKSPEKRKPRRKHDVSEISDSDFALRTRAILPTTGGDNDSGNSSDDDDTSDSKSCSYLSQHDAQFHAIQKYALNSCPELHRQIDDLDRSILRRRVQGNQAQVAELQSKLEKSRHRYHIHPRSAISRQFRWLGSRFRRSGSSTFSIKSEIPAHPNSKERRSLARDSADIWPSSGEETPLFNTPESNIANASPIHNSGHHLDPLAMASMMIATAELDRLSSRASLERKHRTSESSTGFAGGSPTSPTPFYGGVAAPGHGVSMSDSNVLDVPSTVPFGSPLSSGPGSGVASPVSSRPPQRLGQRRRAQRSRLSEVTTPEDIASPAESVEDLTEGRSSFSSSHVETFPEYSTILNSVSEDSLYPKPLEIRRGGQGTRSRHDSLPGDIENRNTAPGSNALGNLYPTPPKEYGTSPPMSHSLSSSTEDVIPTRTQSRIPASRNEDPSLDSCHPDTWSETQGEPGDSDPFCPHECLETRHSSQDSYTGPWVIVRQDSDASIRTVVVGERARSSVDRVVESMHKRKDTNSEPARL
ncbi:hypothetical protein F5Y04DRAFT_288954 [Hypomontagnella monticulosa]|nr:hypothetical protein F5Y04DRAFT_288954 [Hypomontagnella monticulosa]